MTWKSNVNPMFRSSFSEDIFNLKYRHEGAETWDQLARLVVEDVCRTFITKEEKDQLYEYIRDLKFIPGGRYLYYAGKPRKYFNNCYLLRAEEDTREDWANLSCKSELALASGGGIGCDYSIYRPSGRRLYGTGGVASGPLAKMEMINEIGRHVMQGGSRRSAIYASLSCEHEDIHKFMHMKDWSDMKVAGTNKTVAELKEADFNYKAPMDMTNISVNYGTNWLLNYIRTGDVGSVFSDNVRQALVSGDPGFSFNFFDRERETLRNACTEVTSEDDSDVCNLGSVNMGRIDNLPEFYNVCYLATLFLLCGTMVAHLPYKKVEEVRSKNRRLGLGLMGIHEWLLRRGYTYQVKGDLRLWLKVYKDASTMASRAGATKLNVSIPVANRAIAPTGTIGILAGTSTGIEPVFAVAFKRRYYKNGEWHYQYVVDAVAQELINEYSVDPDKIETALDLANDPERRIRFQADVQDYVDMGISSTINLPKWGSRSNNDDTVAPFASLLAKYAYRLRGFTCYPSGSRGGQPLTVVDYKEAKDKTGEEFKEEVMDICDITGKGGSCGV